MSNLKRIESLSDISAEYRNTPIEKLLQYHNLNSPFDEYYQPELLIGTCMDFRVYLKVPQKFAYVIRAGGANLQYSDFHISFAVSIAKIKHMAVIGHTDCGMVNLESKKEPFIDGLQSIAGISKLEAERHFEDSHANFEIGNEIDFTLKQAIRLRSKYPEIKIAPMIYKVEDNKLYVIQE